MKNKIDFEDLIEARDLLKSRLAWAWEMSNKKVPVGYCVAVWLTTVILFMYWG